jgi:hypothetical protein
LQTQNYPQRFQLETTNDDNIGVRNLESTTMKREFTGQITMYYQTSIRIEG